MTREQIGAELHTMRVETEQAINRGQPDWVEYGLRQRVEALNQAIEHYLRPPAPVAAEPITIPAVAVSGAIRRGDLGPLTHHYTSGAAPGPLQYVGPPWWRPMKDAPKDGTTMLLLAPKKYGRRMVGTGRYSGHKWSWPKDDRPTHWMPFSDLGDPDQRVTPAQAEPAAPPLSEQWRLALYPHVDSGTFHEFLADHSLDGWDDVRREVAALTKIVEGAALPASSPAAPDHGPWKMTVTTWFRCPECGPCGVDEDSCCSTCGSDVEAATGRP